MSPGPSAQRGLMMTFRSVSVEVLRHLPLGTKVWAAIAWACVGGSLAISLFTWHALHAGGNQLMGAAAIWVALLLLGAGARFWNWEVMPKVFLYLWDKAAERGLADKYAAIIRLRIGESMRLAARERGFCNLVRGYCAACRA